MISITVPCKLVSRLAPSVEHRTDSPSDLVSLSMVACISDFERELAELRAHQASLRESEDRFRILTELVTDCCWARWGPLDGTTERVWVNDAFERLTGYSPEEFDQIGREGLVHPDDLAGALEYVDGPPGTSELVFRIIRKDGEVRWLHERMAVTRSGDELRVVGATRDITAEKEAERLLRETNDELERRVATRTRELEEMNLALQQEIDHRIETERSLRRAKEAAEAASRAKSQFLATINHELRTPLSGVLGATHLLATTELDEDPRRFVDILVRSTTTLHRIIDELLEFSRLDSGVATIDSDPFELLDLVRGVVADHREAATGKNLDLTLEVEPRLPTRVLGDEHRLRRVLELLLGNAIKFTHQGKVRLIVGRGADSPPSDQFRFEVSDTGIGIAPEDQNRVLEAFTQADGSTTRRYSGMGLGLTTADRLVRLLGGDLHVESRPGAGSRFWFECRLTSVE